MCVWLFRVCVCVCHWARSTSGALAIILCLTCRASFSKDPDPSWPSRKHWSQLEAFLYVNELATLMSGHPTQLFMINGSREDDPSQPLPTPHPPSIPQVHPPMRKTAVVKPSWESKVPQAAAVAGPPFRKRWEILLFIHADPYLFIPLCVYIGIYFFYLTISLSTIHPLVRHAAQCTTPQQDKVKGIWYSGLLPLEWRLVWPACWVHDFVPPMDS